MTQTGSGAEKTLRGLCAPAKFSTRRKMDYAYLKAIHRQLFSDLYDFAGETRKVDIAKGDSAFCYIAFIEDEQKRIFRELARRCGYDLSHDGIEAEQMMTADIQAFRRFCPSGKCV